MEEERRTEEKTGLMGRREPLLSVAGLLLLLLFRLPLANVIGDGGNGYLAFSWEIYGLFYLLFGYLYPEAMKSLIAARMARKRYLHTRLAAKAALFAGSLSALIGGGALMVFALFFSAFLPGIKGLEVSLAVFAPLLALQCLLGMLRAYFSGCGKLVPVAISRMIEAVVTATGAFLFVYGFSQYGDKVAALLFQGEYSAVFSAVGVVLGYLAGSLFALLFLAFIYVLYQSACTRLIQKEAYREKETGRSLLGLLFRAAPMILAGAAFLRLYRFIDLCFYGSALLPTDEAETAIRYLGVYYGKVSVLIAIAVVAVLHYAWPGKWRFRHPIDESKILSRQLGLMLPRFFALALPLAGSLGVLAQALLKTIFGSAAQTEILLLRIGAVTLSFAALGICLFRLLLERQRNGLLLVLQFAAFVFQTVVMVGLLGALAGEEERAAGGILAFSLAELSFWLFFSLASLFVLLRISKHRPAWIKLLIQPTVQTAVMLAVEFLFVELLGDRLTPGLLCALALLIGTGFHQMVKRLPAFSRGAWLFPKARE